MNKVVRTYHLDPHEVQKVIECNHASALGVHFGNHLLQLITLGLEAQRTHRDLEFPRVDGA